MNCATGSYELTPSGWIAISFLDKLFILFVRRRKILKRAKTSRGLRITTSNCYLSILLQMAFPCTNCSHKNASGVPFDEHTFFHEVDLLLRDDFFADSDDECPSPQKRRCLEKSRSKNSHVPLSLEQKMQPTQMAEVVESRYAQFVDCRTKNVSTTSRHENLASNIQSKVSHASMKWYRLLQIAVCENSRRQLQTPCRCGKIRTFTHRRAVRKGIAITYFATNACSCGHEQTDKLLMCFCGALFRTTASLYKCPCFGRLGPAFVRFPSYSEFAARPCACTHTCPRTIQRHNCSCMS